MRTHFEFTKRFLSTLAVSLLAAACGGGDDGGGGGGTTPDAATTPADASSNPVTCTGAHDIDVQWSTTPGGSLAIAGTITLPSSLPAGRMVRLEGTPETPDAVSQDYKDVTFTSAKTTLTYRFGGMPDDTIDLIIGLYADVDGNDSVNDTGDLIGYYNGTVASPITDSTAAESITISGTCRTGVDFGVGHQ